MFKRRESRTTKFGKEWHQSKKKTMLAEDTGSKIKRRSKGKVEELD